MTVLENEGTPIPNEPQEPAPAHARPITNISRDFTRPPQSPIAERAAIGAALLNQASADAVAAIDPGDFSQPSLAKIAAVTRDLRLEGYEVDYAMVAIRLQDDHSDQWDVLLNSLMANAPSYNAMRYLPEIQRLARHRKIISAAEDLREAAWNGNDERQFQIAARVEMVLENAIDEPPFLTDDVAAVVRGEVQDIKPTMLRRSDGAALMYPGLSHILMGQPTSGKTFVALHAVAELLLDGHNVLYLDWEGNRQVVGSRLRALGVPADMVEEQLIYPRKVRPFDPALSAALTDLVKDRDIKLVVCDGVAKAMQRQGFDEESNTEYLKWEFMVVHPATEAGAAVLMLDHITKESANTKPNSIWARGAGAKMGEVTGAAWVARGSGFSRTKAGIVNLVQAKDREGYNGVNGDTVAAITFRPDDHGELLHVSVDAPIGDKETPSVHVMARVSHLLERGTALPRETIRELMSDSHDAVDRSIVFLVRDRYVRNVGGYLQSIRPYSHPDVKNEESF